MNPIQLLDVSLRDGGHRTNFHFSDEQLKAILSSLDNSGMEYIEIGYRNGSIRPIENLGRAGLCDNNFIVKCKSFLKNSKIAVMAHPNNVTESDLVDLKSNGISLLRVCVAKDGLTEAIPIIKLAKKINLDVSINFIHLSYYTDDELDTVVEQSRALQPAMIYFADSNGALLPNRIKAIYEQYTHNSAIPFGFHAHDNLGLAQANALAAIGSGVRFIDASLAGMGKGTGNLKTEFFIAYLRSIGVEKYNLEASLTAANYVRSALGIGQEPIEMDEFVRGITNLSTADLKLFKLKTGRLF